MNIAATISNLFTYGEKRHTSISDPATPLTGKNILHHFGLGDNKVAGMNVTEQSALRFSAVWACVRILSEGIASLPFEIFEDTGNGVQKATSHPLWRLVNQEPSGLHGAFTFHEAMQTAVTLYGNAYALIRRNNMFRPTSFKILFPWEVEPIWDEPREQIMYRVRKMDATFSQRDIIHIPGLNFDGVIGQSPIQAARVNIGLGLATQQFGADFYNNGAWPGTVLQYPGNLSEQAKNNIKNSFNQHRGPGKTQGVDVLEEGMTVEKMSIPQNDAQFIETRKFQINEIARLYRVPPHLLQDLERATFSNIEQQDLDYVRHTLRPWIKKWESEYNRKIFREDEKGRFYVKVNLEALLRGDTQARSKFYREMFNIGVYSPNEIREKENDNPYVGGDRRYVQGALVPVDKVDQNIDNNGPGQSQNINVENDNS